MRHRRTVRGPLLDGTPSPSPRPALERRVAGSWARPAIASALLLSSGLAVGCGREATEAECMEILERVARLEYQRQLTDAAPEDIDARIARTKQQLKAKAKHECVGRRISDAAMRCVREADSAETIEKECFRWRLFGGS